ncbi:MAG: hypothetical protein JSV35_06075, partial [Candidatus Bathyarchaeota archaeon]
MKTFETYTVSFKITKENRKELLALVKNLANKDETFRYWTYPRGKQPMYIAIRDHDKKRVFRRAMWIKERLE